VEVIWTRRVFITADPELEKKKSGFVGKTLAEIWSLDSLSKAFQLLLNILPVHLTTTTNRSAAVWPDQRWSVVGDITTWLRTFTPDIGTHLPVMALPGTPWVQLNRLRTSVGRFRTYFSFCGLWVWRKRTDRCTYCPSLSNSSTFPWKAWPDGSGWRAMA